MNCYRFLIVPFPVRYARNLQKLRVNNVTRGKLLADHASIASTSSTRRAGLLKHTKLDPGDGLWIVPSEGVHTFGMKFAIDVLFLDKKRRVKKMRPNMVRGKLAFSLLSHSTLELPAGTIEETGTQAGDQLEMEKYETP
jgi:uncharacterized membrane protein (UPF0127 family)